MLSLNPYIAGDPIRSEQGFFGRDDILRQVNQLLRNPSSNAIVLYGQRRIGKTSVLLQLERRLLKEGLFTPVYFDLHDKASKPLPELLYELAATICRAVNKDTPNFKLFDISGHYFRVEFLPEVNNSASKGGLVLLFDEFDVLDSLSRAQAGQSFFPYLREVLAEIKSVRFIFVIGRRPEDLSTDTLLTFKSIRAARVSRLDKASSEAMIRQSEKKNGLFWTNSAVEYVWEICQGHSYLTQLLCSVIFERFDEMDLNELPEVEFSHVDSAIAEALEQGNTAFHWIWAGLPPAERVVIAAMAEAESDVITQDELIETLNRSGVRLIVRQLELAPETLVDWELLRESNRGYNFVVPLLKQWVARNRPLRRVKDELDRLDPLAEGLFQTGQHFYRIGQPSDAESQLRQSLIINPNHLKTRLLLGRILLETGRAEESAFILEEAYKYDDGAARADLIKALLALADANQEELDRISLYERILSIDRNQPFARERLDIILRERLKRELLAKARLAEKREAEQDWEASIFIYKELLTEDAGNHVWQVKLENAQYHLLQLSLVIAEGHELKEEWSQAEALYSNLAEQYPAMDDWEARLQNIQYKQHLAITYDQALGALANSDPKTAMNLLAEVIYRQPNYKLAAQYLLYSITGIDIVKLQERINELEKLLRTQQSDEHIEAKNINSLGTAFSKALNSDNPNDLINCPECEVKLKAKNLARHFIQYHRAVQT